MRGRDRVGAVIAAAGASTRMGEVDKIFFAPSVGRPLIAEVIEAFQNSPSIDEIVIVLRKGKLNKGKELVKDCGFSKVKAICQGGKRRQDSVRKGLMRLAPCQWVVVHDGARPLVSVELIEAGLDAAQETGAAIAAVPVTNTIKAAHSEFVAKTLKRAMLQSAQTPQVFRFDLLWQAHEKVKEKVTDDAQMVEKLGHKVKFYSGSYQNIKITTPIELKFVEFILNNRKSC
jgi:2-C-methyl-D-erythritol 4-phosphate cytidylyltransferase